MMWRKFLVISMVLAFGMILLTAPTWATCEQEDLEGAWDVRIGATDEFGDPCWENANLTIGSGGIVEGGTYLDCISRTSLQVTGGSLTISSESCEIEGYIETSSGTVDVHSGAIVGDQGHLSFGRAQD